MHNIVLIRHGEAAKSPTESDPDLTEQGRRQATELAKDLQRQYPHGAGVRLISSPKARALQTARPVSNLWKKSILRSDDFIEIPSPENIPLAQRGAWIQEFLNSSWESMTSEQVLWRRRILQALIKQETDQGVHTTLIFCHFMVINTVVAAIRGDHRVTQFLADYTSQTHLSLKSGSGRLNIVRLGQERASRNQIQ
ncbi:histidine phosphatase family protein [Microbulbifer sp. HZ11]|nr:histidine phosphatase family protein [Microbulbifer sp. HZ11]